MSTMLTSMSTMLTSDVNIVDILSQQIITLFTFFVRSDGGYLFIIQAQWYLG